MGFGHLHRHGEFSRLDGIGTAKQYAKRAAELNHEYLAQTDHGTLSGALHHITACREEGILPIVGVEAYYRPDRSSRMTRQAWHLILLVKNLTGWHNLLRLVSTAYAEQEDGGGFYQQPCIDDELLRRHHEGLICTTACFQSWLAQLIRSGDSIAAKSYVQTYKQIFGNDFWLEIMPHDFDDQRMLNVEIARLAHELSVPLVATNDTHFVYPDWAKTQQVAKMMSTNLSFSKIEAMLGRGEEPPYMAEIAPTLYMATENEMYGWFEEFHPNLHYRDVEDALENTYALALTVKPFLLNRSIKMPHVTKNPDAAEQTLSQWIDEGLKRIRKEYPEHHWQNWDYQIYEKRVDFEWKILVDKDAISYMVMVADIIRWAKSKGIRIGLGRGSAAGCLISYLVGITAVDPIPWGLLFERFLNPGRKGMPDIDIDVQSGRRDEVKEYIIKKYGADHVADIITHERFQPKSVIQSLCRAFDIPYMEAQAVTDTIDIRQDDEETTLEELLPLNEKLREFKSKYPHIWQHAIRLEGSVKNAGKHAAGVVITPKPIIDYMALERGKKGDLVTSWSDSAEFMVISDYGFTKIDLLGITGLERHDYACRLIKEHHGIDVDLNKLDPLRDPNAVDVDVMALFSEGFTIGLFQFGGKGITNLLKSIKPDSALDLAAANALYRPGPMNSGVTWDYARIKRGDKEPPEWSRNSLVWPVLGESYGLVAYQEQVMEIAKRMGNFTPAQADDLRKAMGKLYRIKGGKAARQYMDQHHTIWMAGTHANGIAETTRKTVWDQILGFGGYGFNKCASGDTVVIRSSGNQHQPAETTLEQLYKAWHSDTPVGKKYRSQGIQILQMSEDGRVRPAICKGVYFNGVRPVVEIKTKFGRKIRVTENHRMLCSNGKYMRADELSEGDELVAMGEGNGYFRKGWQTTRARGKRGPFLPGCHNIAFIDGRHIVFEEMQQKVSVRAGNRCENCLQEGDGKKHSLEFAHLRSLEQCGDDYAVYHAATNVKLLCNSCHKTLDYAKGERVVRWTNGRSTLYDEIISIRSARECRVYDVEMDTSDHNFIANELVSHNSHSGCYSLQAYQDAWLKRHYPLEFYAAVLTYPSGSSPQAKQDFINAVVREARIRGIRFLPPDILRSELKWIIDGDEDGPGIRFNLVGIKDVGEVAAARIIATRDQGFESLDDMRAKCGSKVNKKVIEALTESGALDCFGLRDGWSGSEISRCEKERLRMLIKGTSQADRYAGLIRPNIYTQEEVEQAPKGAEVIIGGEITKIDRKKTKNGNDFANVTVTFEMNEWRVKFWENELLMFEEYLEVGTAVMINGKKDEWQGYISVIAKDLCDMESMAEDAKRIDEEDDLIAQGIIRPRPQLIR